MTGQDAASLGSLVLIAAAIWMLLRGHLVPRRQDRLEREWARGLRQMQERHAIHALTAQVGSGHQRSTMKWSKEVGWRAEEAVALSIRRPGCRHERAIPVESVLDPEVILARLCPDCNEQLEPLPEGAQVIVAGDFNKMMDASLSAENRILLFPAFEGDSGCRPSEPECCDCQEAHYETPEETARRPIHVHTSSPKRHWSPF